MGYMRMSDYISDPNLLWTKDDNERYNKGLRLTYDLLMSEKSSLDEENEQRLAWADEETLDETIQHQTDSENEWLWDRDDYFQKVINSADKDNDFWPLIRTEGNFRPGVTRETLEYINDNHEFEKFYDKLMHGSFEELLEYVQNVGHDEIVEFDDVERKEIPSHFVEMTKQYDQHKQLSFFDENDFDY